MKQKKRELMMQEYGKYCLDMSKLIFGGVILAGIMNLGVDDFFLFGVGGVLVALFASMGFVFLFKIKIGRKYELHWISNSNRCYCSCVLHFCNVV